MGTADEFVASYLSYPAVGSMDTNLVAHLKPALASELLSAIALTTERESISGVQWCPGHTGEALKRLIAVRGIILGRTIGQVVRLARLLALASSQSHKAGYVQALYVDLPLLRPDAFRRLVVSAAAKDQLPVRLLTVSANGVTFHEPQMRAAKAAEASDYSLDYNQMPRLAALLDIMHNALGFVEVERELAPILNRAAPTARAEDVTKRLAQAFVAWLDERLESTHFIEQSREIRRFLAGDIPLATIGVGPVGGVDASNWIGLVNSLV